MVEATLGNNDSGSESGKIGIGDTISQPDKPEGGSSEPSRVSGFEFVSPADLGSAPGDSGSGRRGRPRGSKNRPRDGSSETKAPSNLIESLESLLLSVHLMGAAFLDMEELALDQSEAKRISQALTKVAEFYPVSISPKRLALAELGIVMAGVYGPRAVAIYKRAPKSKPGPQRVATAQQQAQPQPRAQEQQRPNGSLNVPSVRPLTQTGAPRVPSEMWGQDGQETASDQA